MFQVLQLGIILLLGGNTKIQEKFFDVLVNDYQNMFLIQLKSQLLYNFRLLQKHMSDQNHETLETLTTLKKREMKSKNSFVGTSFIKNKSQRKLVFNMRNMTEYETNKKSKKDGD